MPFLYGFIAAVRGRRPARRRDGLAGPVRYALDPLMTIFYASPLVALAPLVIVFFGVGVSGKAIIIFLLAVFPFIFNAQAGVRAVDPLLINVVRSMGGTERDLYLKVLVPSVLPYIVAGARIAVGRGLIGILVGEFFAASEGIGYAIARFGDLFALDKMFACILVHHGHRGGADRRHPLGASARRSRGGSDNDRHPRVARPISRAGDSTRRAQPVAADRAGDPRHRQHRRAAAGLGGAAAPHHAVGRHQAVLHHAEPDRRHAVAAVRHRRNLGAARRQRRRASRSGLRLPSRSGCRSAC